MVKLAWQAGESIECTLAAVGIELDQRMQNALRVVGGGGSASITGALQLLNTRGFHLLPDETSVGRNRGIGASRFTKDLIDRGARDLASGSTFGASQFLLGMIRQALEDAPWASRSAVVDKLADRYAGNSRASLVEVPEARALLDRLSRFTDADYQYILLLDDSGLRFRVTSELDDYVQPSDSGLLVPQRALLTHVADLGWFTSEAIDELESLINDFKAKEQQFQEFFERHPHFLRRYDYREVHPHVCLTRTDDGNLIPDFILTNTDAQRSAVVELKRARALKTRLVRHQDNRTRFADAVMEARAQLLTYRDWFEIPDNRRKIMSKVGMEIYRPRMMVIIGRSSDFTPGIERALLESRMPEVEVFTYDDILREAQRRRVAIVGK